VSERPGDPTGLAVVCVTPDGDNAIVVAPGANASLTPGDLTAAAAISVTGPGAQFTPGKAEIERFMRQHRPSVDS
jgi:sugar/nucleoside kinase (ribokinase family)